MKVLKNSNDHVDVLTNTKTAAAKNHIEQHGQFRLDGWYNLYEDWYMNTAWNMNTWMEIYDALDVKPLKKYDNLCLIGGLDLWRSGLTRTSNRVGVFPTDSGQIRFQSVGSHCVNILALLKAHNLYNIPLHELAFDPNEMSMDLFHESVRPKDNYYLYHGYDIPEYGIYRLDSLQYYLENRHTVFSKTEKSIDFAFGYTVLEKSGREKYVKYVDRLAARFQNAQVFVKNEILGIDTTLDRDHYLEKLAESRFTMMLPSYDNHCFSIYRWLEALHHDCLPLIHPDCNLDDVQRSFDVDLSNLVTVDPPSETRRLEILEYLKKKFLTFKRDFHFYNPSFKSLSSITLKRRSHSIDPDKLRTRQGITGENHPNSGKSLSEDHVVAISAGSTGHLKPKGHMVGERNHRYGTIHTDEWIDQYARGKNNPMYGIKGELHPSFGKTRDNEDKYRIGIGKIREQIPLYIKIVDDLKSGKSPKDIVCETHLSLATVYKIKNGSHVINEYLARQKDGLVE